VHATSSRRSDVRLSIAEDAAIGADLVGHVAHAANVPDLMFVATENAAHLIGVAFAGVGDEYLTQSFREYQRYRSLTPEP